MDQQIIAQGLTDAFKENHINPTCPEQIFACENTSSVFYCLSIFAFSYIAMGMRILHCNTCEYFFINRYKNLNE